MTDADAKVRPVQRRRLAVLALLATAEERGLSRDQLVAYLWPESGQESARHSLEQLLYELRRSMADDLFLGVNPLRLNSAVLEADAALFERALATGHVVDAVSIYRGPFLDGFYLTDAPEFEEWATRERSRFAGRYLDALDRLAAAAEAERTFDVAAEWRRKLAALDPLSAPRALALMRALANAGDSAGALNFARTYESLVRLELNAAPDPSVTAYAQKLREGGPASPVWDGSPASTVLAPGRTSLTNQPSGAVVTSSARTPNDTARAPPGQAVALPVRTPVARAALWSLVVMLLLVSVFVARLPAVFRRGEAVTNEARVAVFPARVIGSDSTVVELAEGVMDLVAAALTGDGMPAAVDSRVMLSAVRQAATRPNEVFSPLHARTVARTVGAGTMLLTEVSWLGAGQLRLTGRLQKVSENLEHARAEQRGPVDSLIGMVDGLLAELLLRQAGDEHLRLSTLTTRSLPALAAFLKGRAEHRRGHSEAAIEHFARALSLDSAFALAALELAAAYRWNLCWTTRAIDTVARNYPLGVDANQARPAAARDLWERAMRVAWVERHRLSTRDRALLAAVAGPRFPDCSYAREFLSVWDDAVRATPDRVEGLFSLGDLLLHQGAALGLAEPHARAAASFNRALELDSGFIAPLAGLIELAASEQNVPELRRLAQLYLNRDSSGAQADYVRWRVAAGTSDSGALRELRGRFESLDLATLGRVLTTSQTAGVALEDAVRANQTILRRVSERTQRQIALHNAFWLELNRGRPAAALAVLARKRDLDPNDDLRVSHTLRGALFGDGDLASGIESARLLERRLGWPPPAASRDGGGDRVTQGIFSLALWRLWRGDTIGVAGAIGRIRSGRRGGGAAELLEALLAADARRQDLPLMLQRLDSIAMLGCCSLPHFINFGSARAHERSGDLSGALAAIRRGRWLFPPEYLASYLREEGRLATLTGDREGAIRAYRHYLVLRAAPEPVLRPQADSIRRALAKLETSR